MKDSVQQSVSPKEGRRSDPRPQIDDDEIDLGEYLGALLDARWLILVIMLGIGLLAGAYALLATPIYEADGLLQVEENSPSSSSLSQMSSLSSVSMLSSLFPTANPADTEIAIIQSRMVLGRVVDQLHLDIVAKPHHLPLMGRIRDILGIEDEQSVQIDSLSLPQELYDETLELTASGNGRFTLRDDDGNPLLSGMVGRPARGHGASILVTGLTASVGTRFDVTRLHRQEVLHDFLKTLSVSEVGSSSSKETGVISVVYDDPDPQMAKQVVDTLCNIYLKQNVQLQAAQAAMALKFVNGQLPAIKKQLNVAEDALSRYRVKRGSVDVSMEAQTLLGEASTLQQQYLQLQMKRLELSQSYTKRFPMLRAVDEQMSSVRRSEQRLERKIEALPKTEQEVVRLELNVSVQTNLYTSMLEQAQALEIAQAGTVGDARILDLADLPYKPVKPKKALVIVIGLVLGLFAGIAFVFIRKALDRTIEDPTIVEQQTGLSVYAGLPHSKRQIELHEAMRSEKGMGEAQALLAVDSPNDMAIEGLRSLRTNLHFALMDAPNNVVMITGAAPNLGKSFVCANFGAVLAGAGQRVLVIDGDMRKGHLHEYFGAKREPGLSNVVAGDLGWREAVFHTEIEGLDLLCGGVVPPNPSELLMHAEFDKLLEELSAAYDIVLIDTPPVLAVTDAAIIGKRVGSLFLLLRSGRHTIREIEQSIKYLENAGVRARGLIFNDIMPRRAYYGYRGYGYHYQYDYGDGK